MHVVDTRRHLAAIERENGAFLAAARAGPLDAPIRACPGWQVEDLARHLGSIHRWVLGWLDTGSRPPFPQAPRGRDVLPWLEQGLQDLLVRLRAIDPSETAATFVGPRPAAWWARRQAHEAAVHRWDAEDAVGTPSPVEASLAADGIDELLEVFLDQRLGPQVAAGHGETIHLCASDPAHDVEGGWLLVMGPEGGRWEHGHREADLRVRGPASELFLLMWNRRDVDGLDTSGEAAVLDRWRGAVRI